ncbi:hypothetical protein [Larkinella arboricola]|uniref:hypothetical protein n=1 Tax=Larkinella arboricola TaxID=643671 RepID=UPI0011BAB4D5|nr:hypothetical protein [Larkinella arboricola]
MRSSYYTIYRRLNCFCDQYQDWKELSTIVNHLAFHRNLYGEIHPANIFGIKNIQCGDDEQQFDVFDDDDVFLYIEQDTAKTARLGALKQLQIQDVLSNRVGILDVGKENRKVFRQAKQVLIQYQMDYDELNSHVLRSFQQAIHFDSTYQTRFRKVKYELINQQTRKQEAIIQYEDYGARFYLNIL